MASIIHPPTQSLPTNSIKQPRAVGDGGYSRRVGRSWRVTNALPSEGLRGSRRTDGSPPSHERKPPPPPAAPRVRDRTMNANCAPRASLSSHPSLSSTQLPTHRTLQVHQPTAATNSLSPPNMAAVIASSAFRGATMTPVLRPMSHLAPSTAYLVRMMSTDATGTTRSMEIPVRPSRGNSRKRNGTRNQQSAPSSASKSSNAQGRNSKNEVASPAIQRQRLDVAIVGAPNAGKSQLLNALCGSTVAAVSRKRHTTRSGILGARTVNNQKQLVFVDTPGFMRYKSAKKEGLTRDLRVSAEKEMEDVDYTLVVIDAARRLDDEMKEALVTLMLRAAASRGRIEASVDDDEGVVKTTRSASKKELLGKSLQSF